MGKTYGVYVSDAEDELLDSEVKRRKLLNFEKNRKLSTAKLMSACVYQIINNGQLKEVDA